MFAGVGECCRGQEPTGLWKQELAECVFVYLLAPHSRSLHHKLAPISGQLVQCHARCVCRNARYQLQRGWIRRVAQMNVNAPCCPSIFC